MHVALILCCVVILIRTAWIADDALITVRSALNFVHGYGPTFNIDERVQAYTHPAWFLLLSGLLTLVHNPYLVLWALSFGCTIGACHLVYARLAGGVWQGALGVGVLLASKAFVDFSASGLENPLAHAMLCVYVLVAIRAFAVPTFWTLAALAAVASTVYLTRADLLLLLVPPAAAIAWRQRRNARQVGAAFALGALPAVAWTCVSLWYYGFPFPNTAYAKLGTGLSPWERAAQGLAYLADSFQRDRLTLPTIAAGALLGLRSAGVDRLLALGVGAYVAYILWIGGDFMSGRFLTVPLLAAVILIVRARLGRKGLALTAVAAGLLAVPALPATVLSGPDFSVKTLTDTGIADERGFYFQNSGLTAGGWAPLWHGSDENPRQWTEAARRVVVVCGRLGRSGLVAGPSVHLIDPCGLADPLLSRLPPRQDLDLRVGHFARLLPDGYLESVRDRSNHLVDADLHRFYESLRQITRGPLGDGSRIAEIARINLGMSESANRVRARFWSPPSSVDSAAVGRIVEHGAWDAPGHVVFDRAVDVTLASSQTVRAIDVSLDSNDSYRVDAVVNGRVVRITTIGPTEAPSPPGFGVARHVYVLPNPVEHVTAIRVIALGGDGRYSLGHLVVR